MPSGQPSEKTAVPTVPAASTVQEESGIFMVFILDFLSPLPIAQVRGAGGECERSSMRGEAGPVHRPFCASVLPNVCFESTRSASFCGHRLGLGGRRGKGSHR